MDGQVNLGATLAFKYVAKRLPALSLSTSYTLIKSWDYNTPDLPNGNTITDSVTGTTATVPHSPYDTRLNESGWFLASIDYDVAKYASLSLG